MPWRRPRRRERASLPYFPGRNSTMRSTGGPMGKQIRTLLALAGALVLAGCASTTTSNIDARDSAVIPTARIPIDFGHRPVPPSHVRTLHAIDVELNQPTGAHD